jgi:hypothetical protein
LRPQSAKISFGRDAKDVKNTRLVVQSDRSVLAVVPKEVAKGAVYTLDFQTHLRITGLRIEALTDADLPNGGPGHAGGNFVLTEFVATAAPLKDPKAISTKVEFAKSQADFNQDNFSIAQAISGNPNAQQGWAVAPATGVPHWAVLELKQPVEHEGGTRLQITMRFNFNRPEYLLRKFRISACVQKGPLPLGVSEELQSALAMPAGERDKAAQELLAKYYRAIDVDLRKSQAELAESRKPLPIDPKLKELQESLELESRPIPLDSRLAQLREDVKMSQSLLSNARLTAAQDVAWALINSPAFLFNH